MAEQDWIDIEETNWEDVDEQIPAKSQNVFLNLAKKYFRPMVTPEQIMKSELGGVRVMRQTPTLSIGGTFVPPFIAQSVPPPLRERLTSEMISAETSPASIVSNLMATGGALKQAKMFPSIMGKSWMRKLPQKTVNIVDETIGDYRKAYEDILSPYYQNVIDLGEEFADFGIKGQVSLGDLWKKRNELLRNIYESSWTKSEMFQRAGISQNKAIEVVGRLKNIMLSTIPSNVSETIQNIDPAFSEAIKLGGYIKRKAYNPKTQSYNFKSLIGIFKDKERIGERDIFNRFAELNPEMGNIIKNAQKYVSRQGIKRVVGNVVGEGTKLALLGKILSGIR